MSEFLRLYQCVGKWFNEGIESNPPPCLKNPTIYQICSGNKGCQYLGFGGTEWGAKHRSQIFFVAFWLSSIGMVTFCAALACLSIESSSIRGVSFFQGKFDIIVGGNSSEVHYYAGISRMVFRECDAGALCPPESVGWGDDSCDLYFSNCEDCKFSPQNAYMPIAMALLGQIGQILTDVVRSTAHNDVHCQKVIGVVTGILGTLGTLSTISSFSGACMNALHTNSGFTTNMTKEPGAALILLCICTFLRFFDIWAHIVVPVEENHWSPNQAGKEVNTDKGTSIRATQEGVAMQENRMNVNNPVWVQSDVL